MTWRHDLVVTLAQAASVVAVAFALRGACLAYLADRRDQAKASHPSSKFQKESKP